MPILLCFSHLGWNFVYQRPQHLMSRFAKNYKVYYIEEPKQADKNEYTIQKDGEISVVQLFAKFDEDKNEHIKKLLKDFMKSEKITNYSCWYYTPMALEFSEELEPVNVIYDSMDELSKFLFAPPQLLELEEQLLRKADIVFTGGYTLYNAKKHRHHNIYPFPSSIDMKHFSAARNFKNDPQDQASIPSPRFGFCGVIDERLDVELLREVAALRPNWQFILIGPVVKIDEAVLPKAKNIHYLGPKKYDELPKYLAHWDIGLVLFALNESTEFISPTKTPEYLAAGLPVISTPIKDVINPYGDANLVHIVSNAEEFITAAESELSKNHKTKWLADVDDFLSKNSWDKTFEQMNGLIQDLN